MHWTQHIRNKVLKGSIVEQFIVINLAVFIGVFLVNTLGFLTQIEGNFLVNYLSLPAQFDDFLSKPWTLLSYGFLHVGFIHLLLNLIMLHFIGSLFLDYFSPKQFIQFYSLGTIAGGLVFLGNFNYFPAFTKQADYSQLLGASAGVSALLVGLATYLPKYQLKFRFIGFVHLWKIALFWVVYDLIQIPVSNAGGHLAHLGGALFGFLYVWLAKHEKTTFKTQIAHWFRKRKSPLKTVYKSSSKKVKKPLKVDKNQQKIDRILDRISQSGYETLSEEEKTFLFQQGKKT